MGKWVPIGGLWVEKNFLGRPGHPWAARNFTLTLSDTNFSGSHFVTLWLISYNNLVQCLFSCQVIPITILLVVMMD